MVVPDTREAEDHVDDVGVIEGSTRGNEPEFPVVCRQLFKNTLLVVTAPTLHKIGTFGNNIT